MIEYMTLLIGWLQPYLSLLYGLSDRMVASIPRIIYVYLMDGYTHALCTCISFHYVLMYQRYQLYLHLQVLRDGFLF